ncbi:DUF2141 domain-containing protein [Brevundimonas balnearis]|uniref:DUF2141 domain-containing protein n=1 Tax=Brevundimonas balnearis TaxID=1572858 RepID=A0ABV6R332_9CAUL
MTVSRRFAACLVAASAALCAGFTTEPRTAGPLTLEIACAEGAEGRIAVAVFEEGAGFPDAEEAKATRRVRPAGPVTRVVFSDLPPGRYSVAVFHDADENGRLTLWPVGLPREAYGFSNNARGRFGPPRFEQAAFTLGADGARQAIRLH